MRGRRQYIIRAELINLSLRKEEKEFLESRGGARSKIEGVYSQFTFAGGSRRSFPSWEEKDEENIEIQLLGNRMGTKKKSVEKKLVKKSLSLEPGREKGGRKKARTQKKKKVSHEHREKEAV